MSVCLLVNSLDVYGGLHYGKSIELPLLDGRQLAGTSCIALGEERLAEESTKSPYSLLTRGTLGPLM